MPRRYITVAEQHTIVARAKRRCEYCKCKMDHTAQSFACEHIVPVSVDGATDVSNLALACGGCNGHKYTKVSANDPVSQAETPLFHPRQQLWEEHFAGSADVLKVVGVTPTGRATVTALTLNRPGVMNLRKLLMIAGLHPPSEEDRVES